MSGYETALFSNVKRHSTTSSIRLRYREQLLNIKFAPLRLAITHSFSLRTHHLSYSLSLHSLQRFLHFSLLLLISAPRNFFMLLLLHLTLLSRSTVCQRLLLLTYGLLCVVTDARPFFLPATSSSLLCELPVLLLPSQNSVISFSMVYLTSLLCLKSD